MRDDIDLDDPVLHEWLTALCLAAREQRFEEVRPEIAALAPKPSTDVETIVVGAALAALFRVLGSDTGRDDIGQVGHWTHHLAVQRLADLGYDEWRWFLAGLAGHAGFSWPESRIRRIEVAAIAVSVLVHPDVDPTEGMPEALVATPWYRKMQ